LSCRCLQLRALHCVTRQTATAKQRRLRQRRAQGRVRWRKPKAPGQSQMCTQSAVEDGGWGQEVGRGRGAEAEGAEGSEPEAAEAELHNTEERKEPDLERGRKPETEPAHAHALVPAPARGTSDRDGKVPAAKRAAISCTDATVGVQALQLTLHLTHARPSAGQLLTAPRTHLTRPPQHRCSDAVQCVSRGGRNSFRSRNGYFILVLIHISIFSATRHLSCLPINNKNKKNWEAAVGD
jgi:hypothetical protein